MTHWAHAYIGRPYAADFRCWDLVRLIFAERFGVDMPAHAAGVLNLKHAAEVSGWRQVNTIAQVDDIVLMRNARKDRHVGVFVEANGRVGVLHNDGYMEPDGRPVGAVAFDTLHTLTSAGCSEFEFWRRAA